MMRYGIMRLRRATPMGPSSPENSDSGQIKTYPPISPMKIQASLNEIQILTTSFCQLDDHFEDCASPSLNKNCYWDSASFNVTPK